MTTFILDVLQDLKINQTNFSEVTFVLPSKRAGVFLKDQLPQVLEETLFAPRIISIEEFVEEISQLKSISNTELLFEFYNSYLEISKGDEIDTFETFSKWAQILLQDFNEIDRYLIPQEHIFEYLAAIEDLKHWSLEEPKTEFVKNYLAFWNKLFDYYKHFTKHLIENNLGYQGLIYRKAAARIESYIQSNNKTQHVFLGFNALNTAEEIIIQALLEHGLAKIYWDIDQVFLENKLHDAALFTRQHKKNWNFFNTNPFEWITDNYSKPKNISVFGVPKNIGQAKYIGTLLNDLQKENPDLENTAVVLGDENLLIPVLNSIPNTINALNITMGFPLKSIPLASLFDALFNLHKTTSKSFYFKDVVKIISHQYIRPLFYIDDVDYATILIETIDTNNLVYLNISRLKKIADQPLEVLELLFSNWNTSVDKALNNCSKLILTIKKCLDEDTESNILSLEYLFRFNELFNALISLNTTHKHISDISTLYSVYKELLSSESLDFQGEPLQGLQVMGMLESRVLDFETVIISSVNEGVLPSGKSNNSFIPFDVKIENKLPTYKEKDAVYTYHFYRLLQRAKNVFILYNTEADVLTGGEKSRFITQLELEGIHDIKQHIIAPQVPIIEQKLNVVKKTPKLSLALAELAGEGFSPSSLTTYMRNPIDFYYQKILKIRDHNDVEETVAANTLGTVVHNTLEDFYDPLKNTFITVDIINALRSKIEERVSYHFKKEYKEGDITKGKNLIISEIAKRYVSNFLDLEIKSLKAGNKIKIIAIEADNNVLIDIPELDFPVKLRGKVDRVDECNGIIRIIDYKTGKVDQNQVEIVNWEDITTDYKKFSKSFQILAYAYMMQQSSQLKLPIEAGIISFKNLSSGFLKFSKKESGSRSKNTLISEETISAFETELKALILEICNPNIDFTEKEV
ncbi:PD-(D/E)XK nuclease family protein [Tamlana sp. 2_MG-2023]|uniref:PD-(D/E)XK nuclease family protein n=1 Tax=unclassified Tamlana TaxID=2614803 RepID=UPI0026E1351D|nr:MULTISPECIES: PD-(D/E)XK nuclease family protein [unclassified Tamlana]MDO6761127.1 PD-(D/E)XK nuclease family protein [Tamlana sp. 2_MG-2023]MDO6791540.1 PD-(D/E)XK nuclease family protein [Tamlana sp. 1_MG-2023]